MVGLRSGFKGYGMKSRGREFESQHHRIDESVFTLRNLLQQQHSENTHSWGKYHCMAGLQFYKFRFSCFTTYKKQYILFLGQVQSCFTGDQLSTTVSVLCLLYRSCFVSLSFDFSWNNYHERPVMVSAQHDVDQVLGAVGILDGEHLRAASGEVNHCFRRRSAFQCLVAAR